LKRPDEKAVTERAYANPVFVEDLVRAIASHANQDPNILWYRVEAENFESIHNHNAYALVEGPRETPNSQGNAAPAQGNAGPAQGNAGPAL
jgi:GTP cyclohydrolase I